MESGKLYFFTATILNWQHLLATDECKQIIIDEWKRLIKLHRITLYAFVIMPNHYHIIWSVSEKYNPEDIQRDFHKWTAKQLIALLKTNQPQELSRFHVDAADRNFQIWERNPLPVELYTEEVIWQKLEYLPTGRQAFTTTRVRRSGDWHRCLNCTFILLSGIICLTKMNGVLSHTYRMLELPGFCC